MKNEIKKEKKTKILTQRVRHILTLAVALTMFVFILCVKDWSVYLAIFTPVVCTNKCEPEDELYRENLHKSNTVVMWFLIAAVIVFGMYSRAPFRLGENIYFSVVPLMLALRSALFLWFDRTPGDETDGE